MSVELTDLDGIGPARSNSLKQANYKSVEDIAGTDPEKLAEEVDVPEDTALSFVVQSENIIEEEKKEEEEEKDEKTVAEEISEGLELDEEEKEEKEEEDPVIEFEVNLDTELQHDTFFAAIMRHRETMLKSNRSRTDIFDDILDQMRSSDVDDPIELAVEQRALNDLHNAVRKLVVEYQGDNLIDHMNALKDVQKEVDRVRQENLF